MPSLRKTAQGSYIACFRHAGRQYQRALKTKDPEAAEAAMGLLVHRLYKLRIGELKIPVGRDLGDFVMDFHAQNGETDRAAAQQESGAAGQESGAAQQENGQTTSIDELIDEYLQVHRRLKAESTLRTERTHLDTFRRLLGPKANLPAGRIQDTDLDEYLATREDQVEPVTVLKERQTIQQLFGWAAKKKKLAASPATDLRRIQAGVDTNRFRTLEEVEEILGRGGLSDAEVLTYWDCLYLTPTEVGEILSLVHKGACDDFIYPMFAVAAYTGMRRAEIICRLRWPDVDFKRSIITARSKKQSRQEIETSRQIEIHRSLSKIYRGT